MIYSNNCDNSLKNFYQADCEFIFAEAQQILFSRDPSFCLPYPVTDKALEDAIFNKKLFVLRLNNFEEDTSADAITEEINGNLTRVREGQYRYVWDVPANHCTYESLVSWEGQMRKFWIIDKKQRIGGFADQLNDRLCGATLDQFYANKPPIISTGTETPKFTVDTYFSAEQFKINEWGFVEAIEGN